MSCVALLFDGETLEQIAERTGISYAALFARYQQHGHPLPPHLGEDTRANRYDLTGKTFERLKAISRDGVNTHGRVYYQCQCECGKTKRVRAHSLMSGQAKSCGCLRAELREAAAGQEPKKTGRPARTFDGLTIVQWAERTGLSIGALKARVLDHGHPMPAHLTPEAIAVRKRAAEKAKQPKPQKQPADLTGRVFGRLTVTAREGKREGNGRNVFWICSCSCGSGKVVRADSLTQGQTTSCGCVHKELSAARMAKGIRRGTGKHAEGTAA
ncbi:hypothetical protein [Paraburkholderia haematera]|uniref:Uncharacterized protein n=1 Tax=Paraburkholderia haematera TaxID=2793077 RepID=A0ABN7KYV3_9BURK|nr:hypothetical protein [Paraburkholderia haematera]CAE6714179.1 hypothetical protein R69888_01292 [Paraburkholderia haematera]